MSVLRVMSVETEYGISVPGQPGANAMVTSSQIVNAYQAATAARARRARWDFEEENPLRDARGFDLARENADTTQLTDEDLGLANVILTNGARLYVDHAHPEYSTPECTNPLSAVIWDKAGERIMAEAAERAATIPGAAPIQLYKNNTDNKGASYGTHENYLMRRATPLADIVRHLTPLFVTPPGMGGAGGDGRRRPGHRVPAQPAGRLLRGRGRPGDHAQAADHQYPRRAARRPGEVPAAARDTRASQHGRGRPLPQARPHRAGAGHDRGQVSLHRRRRGPVPGVLSG